MELNNIYKKAIVTGGAGFVGSHLVEELLDSGLEVVSIDDFSAGKMKNLDHLSSRPGLKIVRADISDRSSVEPFMDGVDVIFNNAASKKNICLDNPERDLEVNARGTLIMLELAKKYGVKKFVHASTGSVYGEPSLFPQTEEHPLDPVSYYGVSKLAGERYVILYSKLFGLDTTCLRYFHVYGPRQESNEFGGVVSIFIRNMLNGENLTIFGDGTQQRSFTWVKDIVKANILVATKPEANGECYNCASGITVTINELAEFIYNNMNSNSGTIIEHGDWLIGDIMKFDVSNDKIRSLGLNFETDFWEKLRITIAEMQTYLSTKV
ncbi:SDR family NAD(P)-dependent oxidoreductase [Schleiferiaceae bacterium]|nr:SDR family NAD(P)-dependent oxidoreductase [Schleiferiaceae bacterium]